MGAPECVEVVRQIGNKQPNQFTPEEDFILGTMLGYDRLQLCRRYIKRAQFQNHRFDVMVNSSFLPVD